NVAIGPSTNISLVTLVNTLCQGVIFLLMGSISDIIGRRYFVIGGQIFGVIGGIIGATSKDVNMLIGASVMQGIGCAVQLSYPLLVMEIIPNKYRGWGQGMITLLVLPSLGFGPIVARTIVQNVAGGWRFTYWLATIINGIGLVLFIFFYFPPNFRELQPDKSRMREVRQIDYIGFVATHHPFVIYVRTICLLLALTWGGATYPWKSGKIIALLIVGCLGLIAFFLYEIFMPLEQPLLPMQLFKIRNYWIAVLIGSIAQMSYYALNIFWPQQCTVLFTTNNITIGWLSCTTGAALSAGEILMGPLFKRLGHMKLQLIASVVGLCLFGGLMAYANESREGLAIAATAFTGFMVGWTELITIVTAGLVVPPDQIGVAQAFFGSTRAVTGTVASCIYLAIYGGEIATKLPSHVTAHAVAAGLPESSVSDLLTALPNGTAAAFEAVAGVNSTILAAIGAGMKSGYSASYSTVYLSSLAFGGTALIASFFTSDIDKYLTDFVNKTVAGKEMRTEHEHHEKKPGIDDA
ncbi:siderophore iron transporter, partial [Amniculicola lignicola CBS 123094]